MLKRSSALISLAAIVATFAFVLSASGAPRPQTVTLYSPIKYKDDFTRASFDFEHGQFGTKAGWDLVYGQLYAADDRDWFTASTFGNNRHVIRDLGTLDWTDPIQVPTLAPRPEAVGGKRPVITVNTSGGEYDEWTKQAEHEGIFTRALIGHMYALHAKNQHSDYYVLFRVESIEHGDHCTISWRRAPTPK